MVSNVTYVYNDAEWKDLLTSYNGQTLTYDAIGNPLNYRDGITLTWQNGRELASYSDSTQNITYTYDASGMRTGKTVTKGTTTDTYQYVYEGGQLLKMKCNSMTLEFAYDALGNPVSVAYRSVPTANPIYYYYALNSRGDVIGLYNSNGVLSVKYSYDAYGKLFGVTTASGSPITSSYTLAVLNPLRYRGYVYDNETGLYYLNSRYYDPVTCRFVSADTTDILTATFTAHTDKNLFAYCDNNPISRIDTDGDFWNTLVGAVAGGIVGGITAAIEGEDVFEGIVDGAVSGAVSGAIVDFAILSGGTGLAAFTAVTLVSAAAGGAISYAEQRIDGKNHSEVDFGEVAIDALWSGVGGALSFGLADVGGPTCKKLSEILALPIKELAKQAVDDIVTDVTVSLGTWINEKKMKMQYKRLS